MYAKTSLIIILLLVFATGCAVNNTGVKNEEGRATTEIDPQEDPLGGLGVDSKDVIKMVDQMMRDMLANPTLANRIPPPLVVVDSAYVVNESSQPLNKNVITDLLRTELVRAASGRMVFLARHAINMVEDEKELENKGTVTSGTTTENKKPAGWDYRMSGRITSIDEVNSTTGMGSRYYQFTFEMVERGSTVIVWAGAYKVKKVGRDDVSHR